MDNPLRSEAAMFRVVVLVGIAAVPVIALGLVAGAGWALAAAVIELVVATVLLRRRSRAARAQSPPPPT